MGFFKLVPTKILLGHYSPTNRYLEISPSQYGVYLLQVSLINSGTYDALYLPLANLLNTR